MAERNPSFMWLCLTIANWRVHNEGEDLYTYVGRKFIADHGFADSEQVKEARKVNTRQKIDKLLGSIEFDEYNINRGNSL